MGEDTPDWDPDALPLALPLAPMLPTLKAVRSHSTTRDTTFEEVQRDPAVVARLVADARTDLEAFLEKWALTPTDPMQVRITIEASAYTEVPQ